MNYDSKSIKVYKGLQAVRKRPAMYIGSTSKRGLHHMIWEIYDNSVDEVLAGYCDQIIIQINKDNSITIKDNGRGIPVGNHSKGKSALEVVLTTLHAGGKFGGEDSSYKVSGGLHGVGASVVNALSEYLKAVVYRDGYKYTLEFINGGKKLNDLTKEAIGDKSKKGTEITFLADKKIFKNIVYDINIIKEKLLNSSYLNDSLKITFIDKDDNEYKFHNKNGLVDLIKDKTKNKKTIIDEIFHQKTIIDGSKIELAFTYFNTEGETYFSFVNNINTHDGGTHVSSFKYNYVKLINNLLSINKNIKSPKLESVDIREGIYVAINLQLEEKHLEFESQTKEKLSSPKAKVVLEKLVEQNIKTYLIKNIKVFQKIVNNAIIAQKARVGAKNLRDNIKKLRDITKNNVSKLLGKLIPAQSKNSSETELFLVEGDSAGGSAKLGRNPKIQAILPLKGKIVNVEKTNSTQLLKNEEIINIISAVGTGIGKDFDINKLKYSKIIIMTDADNDGAHIQTLILTFFYRYMHQLIEANKIYIALPPLYKFSISKTNFNYYWDKSEIIEIKQKHKNATIQRYKGLGEMNYDQLWDTTMNPDTRKLIQVKIIDDRDSMENVVTLMGSDSSKRKDWINENINFTIKDDYLEIKNINNEQE